MSPDASIYANSILKTPEVVKLSALSPKFENLTSDTHRQQASKQADVQRRYDLENCSLFNPASEPTRSPRVDRDSPFFSVFAKPDLNLAVKRNKKEVNVMQNICWQDVVMSIASLFWQQNIHCTTSRICSFLEYGVSENIGPDTSIIGCHVFNTKKYFVQLLSKSHMTKPHPPWSHLSITGPGPPLPPAIAGSLETAITATTTVSQRSQNASPTPVPLPSRTPRPHKPVSLMPTATWLTSAVPVPAAEQTTLSPPMKPMIVTKHPKNGAGSTEQFPEVSLSQPSSAVGWRSSYLDGATDKSRAT